MRTINPETPKDLLPHLDIGTTSLSEKELLAEQGWLIGAEAGAGSWTGYDKGRQFLSKIAIAGSELTIIKGTTGLARLHDSGKFVNVLSVYPTVDGRDYATTNTEGSLEAVLQEAVARSLYDQANGVTHSEPELAKRQLEIVNGTAALLDIASGLQQAN